MTTEDLKDSYIDSFKFCCRQLQWSVTSGLFGLQYEQVFDEILLTGINDGTRYCILIWCPFCGTQLPASRRPGRVERSNPEARMLMECVSDKNTLIDVYASIGEPDIILDSIMCELTEWDPWVRSHVYFSKYSTCMLCVKEYRDGRLRKVLSSMSEERRSAYNKMLESYKKGSTVNLGE